MAEEGHRKVVTTKSTSRELPISDAEEPNVLPSIRFLLETRQSSATSDAEFCSMSDSQATGSSGNEAANDKVSGSGQQAASDHASPSSVADTLPPGLETALHAENGSPLADEDIVEDEAEELSSRMKRAQLGGEGQLTGEARYIDDPSGEGERGREKGELNGEVPYIDDPNGEGEGGVPDDELPDDLVPSYERIQWSEGSELHHIDECRPCAWNWRPAGCGNGLECEFCHLCPEGQLREKRKKTERRRKEERQSSRFAWLQGSVARQSAPSSPVLQAVLQSAAHASSTRSSSSSQQQQAAWKTAPRLERAP